MSARLRVEELRAELQRRGLDDSGNKPALVSPPASPQFLTRGPRRSPAMGVFIFCCCARVLMCVRDCCCDLSAPQCIFHQVRRLDAAIRMEEKAAVAAAAADGDGVAADGVVVDGEGNGGGEGSKKRKRTGDGEEEGNGDASLEAAKLEGMSYRELQGLAKSRGLAANGSKKDVIERLLSAPANATDDVLDEKRAPKGLVIYFFFLGAPFQTDGRNSTYSAKRGI